MEETLLFDVCNAEGCNKILPNKRLRCSKCRVICYCSKVCQVSSWPQHKKTCNKDILQNEICQNFMQYNSRDVEYNIVNNLYHAKKWDEIIKMHTKIICGLEENNGILDCHTRLTRMYGMLGEAYQQFGNIAKAKKYKKMSKEVTDDERYPSDSICLRDKIVAYDNYAVLLKHMGDFTDAIVIFQQMQTMPENQQIHDGRIFKEIGDCFFGMGQYTEALPYFVEADEVMRKKCAVEQKKRYNVAICNTFVAMRKYNTAFASALGKTSQDMSIEDMELHYAELDDMTFLHYGVAAWVYYKELKEITHNPREEITDESKLKKINRYKLSLSSAETSISACIQKYLIHKKLPEGIISYLCLSYAYILYDCNHKKKAVKYLQKCLDSEILIARTSCKHCEQVKGLEISMLKCSHCNVTRFCNKVCQRGSYKNKIKIGMGIIVSHRHICPLLKKWKQVRLGNATVASCLDEHLLFLKKCDPLEEILKRRDFVDDTDDYECVFSEDDVNGDNIDYENEGKNIHTD